MSKKSRGVKDWTLGEVRYFTYFLIFPGDHDFWVDQQPFVGKLHEQIRSTRFFKIPGAAEAICKKGEWSQKDHNGVTHRIVVEDFERPRKWGTRR